MGRIAGVTPEETRERLLEAAAHVFGLKGYEGATVAGIAREAGVSTGAIYAHYGTKAELLADSIRHHGERVTAALVPPGEPVDAAGVLTALANRLATSDRSGTSLLAETLLASRRDAEVAVVLAKALSDRETRMAAMVAGGQRHGDLTGEVSADVAARFALMVGVGSLLIDQLDLPAVDPVEWSTFIHRLIGAFTPDPGT